MNRHWTDTTLAAVLVLVLVLGSAGCADINKRLFSGARDQLNPFPTRASLAAPNDLLEPYAFEKIDLVTLVDPDHLAKNAAGSSWSDLGEEGQIAAAFRAFYTYPAATLELRRNAAQERLLASSNQLCNYFKQHLQLSASNTNFVLGSLTTGTAVAAAIISGGASNVLAGIAGGISGIRGEFNQDYFQNLGIQVIVNGIDLRRQRIYDEIALQGQVKTISVYTVEAAIKDAVFYHGQCSLIAGLQEANASIRTVADPGLDAVNRTLVKVNLARRLIDSKSIDQKDLVAAALEGPQKLLEAGTPRGDDASLASPFEVLSATTDDVAKNATALRSELTASAGQLQANDLTTLNGAVTTALGAAVDALAKCKTPATTFSQAVVDKQAALAKSDPTNDTGPRLDLDQALLAARALSTQIKAAGSAFDGGLQTAAGQLKDGTASVAKGGTLDAPKVADVKDHIDNAGTKTPGFLTSCP